MRIRDKRNRPGVADYVRGIIVHANHDRYGAKCRLRWKCGVDPESSEVYGYQNVGPWYISKGTVEHNHCNVILIHSNGAVSRLEVFSDGADGNL